jgi:tetratricopeptide (TPR) repeat protein
MRTRAGRFLRAGHRALRAQRIEAAIEAFDRAIETASDDRRAHIQLALAQARQGKYEAALATTETMVKRFPGEPVVQLFAGRCLLECENPTAAEPLLVLAAKSQPENTLAQQYLALCELVKGDVAAASARIERVGFAANSDFLALFSYEIERRLGLKSPAVDRDAPAPSESLASAIAQLEAQADVAARRRWFAKRARRRVMRHLSKLGERAYDRGNFAAALAAFEAAGRGGSEEMIAYLGAGLSNLRLDRPNQATQVLAPAFARWPDDGFIASNYADALYRAGQIAEALAVFEGIEPAGPEDFHAHYGRGACHAALGHKPAALEQFRMAFENYRLDTMDNCLVPSWQELLKRELGKGNGSPAG